MQIMRANPLRLARTEALGQPAPPAPPSPPAIACSTGHSQARRAASTAPGSIPCSPSARPLRMRSAWRRRALLLLDSAGGDR